MKKTGKVRRRKRTRAPEQLPRPRIFHPAFGIPEGQTRGDIHDIYTDRFVSQLCAGYRISGDATVKALWNFLSFGASCYFVEKSRGEGRPANAAARKQLREIAALARKLSAKLDKLDDDTSELLWAPERVIRTPWKDESITKTEHGLTIYRRDIDERSYQQLYLERDDIREAVQVLGNYASVAAKRIPASKAGAKSNAALSLWLSNARSFWTDVLGRRFTYHAHASEPLSKTFRFCCDALRPLAPDIPTSIIGTAMRKLIANERKVTGRIPVKK